MKLLVIRVPDYLGDLKRDSNVEHCPHRSQGSQALVCVGGQSIEAASDLAARLWGFRALGFWALGKDPFNSRFYVVSRRWSSGFWAWGLELRVLRRRVLELGV